jgi:general stress protein YciG
MEQARKEKSIIGFAAMSTEKQKEIARKGGKAAHEQGVAHEWSSEEVRQAGKKGGQSRGNKNSL